MVGDFVLHPKNNFEPELINYFIDSVSCSFNWKSDELILILPPLCLKWSLIVLKQTLKKFRSDTENVNIQDLLNQSMSKKYLDYFDFLIANPNFERYTSFTNYISKQ
jgi:hypothetical protein